MTQDTTAFDLLDRSLQRFIWRKGWQDLNALQKLAVKPILEHQRDCILSAATASGKTEAAFLPALTYILKNKAPGIRILYVSPLKALINDQYRRLLEMTADLDLTITPWHGDVSAGKKKKQFLNPDGIILVTPESLESLLINHPSFIREAFINTEYIIIDEFHAFISSERGAQLFSQMHRIENLVKKPIVRIGLSATFSNFKDVAYIIRPHKPENVLNIEPPPARNTTLSLKILGYDRKAAEVEAQEKINLAEADLEALETQLPSFARISGDIFKRMRGSVNLVFTNSRSETEILSSILMRISNQLHVPNEFFPHHGMLAKDMREDVEDRLIKGQLPTTAVCTSTLELGIDISDVNTIGQVSAPFSVASLRQRLGRSGRRDGKASLLMFEAELPSEMRLSASLAEKTVTAMAMVELLLCRWYEPPQHQKFYTSTLVQQILSVVASHERVTAKAIYELLCKTGPFDRISAQYFAKILKSLGQNDMLIQLGDNSLALGVEGERLVSNFEFYAAFNSPKEYRVIHNQKEIGRTPFLGISSLMNTFLLGGKGWEIIEIIHSKHIILVKKCSDKCDPLPSNASEMPMHEKIREKMLEIYQREDEPIYLNAIAKEHLRRGRENFKKYGLEKRHVVESTLGIALFPWSNNNILRTLKLLFLTEHIKSFISESHLELSYVSTESLGIAIASILRKAADGFYTPEGLLGRLRNAELEKFIQYLSPEVQRINYYNDQCDVEGAIAFLKVVAHELKGLGK